MIGWGKGWITEAAKIVNVIPPQSINASPVTGLWTNLKHWRRLTYLITIGARAGSAANFTVNQAKTNAGGSSKALTGLDIGYSTGTQSQTTGTDLFQQVTMTSDALSITTNANAVHAVHVRDTQLDNNNDFKFTQPAVAAPGGATLIGVAALLYDGDWSGKENTLPTAVA